MEIFIKNVSWGDRYKNKDAVKNLIRYVLRVNARKSDNIYGATGVIGEDIEEIVKDFNKVKKIYHKTDGVLMGHIIISFSERPSMERKKLIKKIKRTVGYFARNFQTVYSVHEDTDQWHIHIAVNSVSYKDGSKINMSKRETKKMKAAIKKIWNENNVS